MARPPFTLVFTLTVGLLVFLAKSSGIVRGVGAADGVEKSNMGPKDWEAAVRVKSNIGSVAQFKLRTMVEIVERMEPTVRTQLMELYSNQQKRSVLKGSRWASDDQKLTQTPTRIVYSDGQSLLWWQGISEPHCRNFSQRGLTEQLFGKNFNSWASLKSWFELHGSLATAGTMPSYITGFARFLFLVEANRNKLKYKEPVQVHNHRCHMFELTLPLDGNDSTTTKPGKNITMKIYFVPHTNMQLGSKALIPLRLVLMEETADRRFTVDFYTVPMRATSANLKSGNSIANLFSSPVGYSCSKHLWESQKEARAKLRQRQVPKIMSARMEVYDYWYSREAIGMNGDWASMPATHHFIALDGRQKALRYDKLKPERSPERDRAITDYLISIHDLKTGMKYNTRHALGGDANYNPQMLGVMSTAGECVASKTGESHLDTGSDSVLPLGELVYMGSSTVRGIEVEVYEQIAGRLPELFFEPTQYKDLRGIAQRLHDPNVESSLWNETDKFNIIYYWIKSTSSGTNNQQVAMPAPDASGARLTEDSRTFSSQLVRIEVFRRTRLYRLELMNFAWQLTAAPNGDKPEELFALAEHCVSSEGPPSRLARAAYSKLSIEFKYLSSVQGLHPNSSGLLPVLKSAPVRNRGLMRALITDCAPISACQLHNVNSKLIMGSDKSNKANGGEQPVLRIDFSAQMAHIGEQIFEPVEIATGVLISSMASGPTGAASFAECFYEAAVVRRNRGAVLFAFFQNDCYLDTHPTVRFDPSGHVTHESSVFRLKFTEPFYPCEIFRVDILEETDKNKQLITESGRRQMARHLYDDLAGRMITFPLMDAQHPALRPESLLFEITKVNVNYNSLQVWPSLSSADHLRGVALIEGSGGSQLVAATQLMAPDDSDSSSVYLDYGSCHSACVVDFDCRSFSNCALGARFECLKSPLNFGSVSATDLQDQLNKKLREANKTGAKRLSIQLPVNPSSISSSSTETTDEDELEDRSDTVPPLVNVELRVDRRCQIYNKQAIEMFHKLPMSATIVTNTSIQQVNTVEECAESCLNANVRFFRKLARINEHKKEGESQGNNHFTRSLFTKYLRSWCSTFKFLNGASTSISRDLLAVLGVEKLGKNGLCVSKRISSTNKPATSTTSISVGMETYEFKYINLYERVHGIRLILYEAEVNSNDAQLAGINQLENRQEASEQWDVEHCAQACFTQAVGLAPFCKSFDYVISDGGASSYCTFNSISLAEARQSDNLDRLVSSEMLAGATVTHFEPRAAYSLDSTLLLELKTEDEANLRLARDSVVKFSLGQLSIMVILCLAFTSGSVLAIYLNEPLRHKWRIWSSPLARQSSPAISIKHQRFSSNNDDDERDGGFL